MISKIVHVFPLFALLLVSGFIRTNGQNVIKPDGVNADLISIRADLEKRVNSGEFPSISIGVIAVGKTVWKESFGWANVKRKVPATPDTVYALGSLSKSITGTAVFRLVQDGRLNIERPMETYLHSTTISYREGDPQDYKVFHFLNMAAGIPHYWRYCYDDDGDPAKCGSGLIRQASFSTFRPGEVHLYSNLSFGLLSQMVADVAGEPFSRFMREKIFKPTGMNHTFTLRRDIPKSGVSIALPYGSDKSPATNFQFEPAGGGGFYSSLNDLLKYGSLHLNGKNLNGHTILNSGIIKEIHRVRPDMPHAYYANGWGVLPLPDKGKTLISNGAIEGAATTLLVLPDSGLVIAVLVNKTVGNDFTDGIAFKIAGALVPKYKENLDSLFEKVGPLYSESEFKGEEKLSGLWKGSSTIDGKNVTIEMEFSGSEIKARFNGREFVSMSKPTVEQGIISGAVEFELGSQSVPVSKRKVKLQFRRNGDRITGIIQLEILEPRPEFLMPFYFTVERFHGE